MMKQKKSIQIAFTSFFKPGLLEKQDTIDFLPDSFFQRIGGIHQDLLFGKIYRNCLL